MSELRQLPARLDLVRAPDDDLTLEVSVVDSDSVAVDISAWTLEGEACTATVTDAAGGVFTVVPTGATVGVRAWRVSRTAPDVRSLIAGSDRVSEAADTTAGNLSVDLQLVDGDAVTLSVTAGEGSGVVVQDDGTPVGTVGTLNFTGATISAAAGVATIAISAAGVAALNDLSDVATAGGATGDVLTQQADGTFALEASTGGLAAEDIDTLSELNAIVTDATLDDSGASRTPTAHDLAGGLHNAATLAGLNAKISDATLDDASDTRTPASHGDEAHNTAYATASGQYAVNTVAASGATETLPATHPAHDVTMDQNCTFTFAAPAAGHTFLLKLSGAFTPTFPAAVVWDGGTAPTYASPSVYGFTTLDGGTSWYGSLVGSAFA